MENIFGKNWMTSLGGLIAALAGLITLLPKSLEIDPQWAIFGVAVGGAISGFAAKSFNVHSTEAETKIATVEKKEQAKK